MVGRRRVIIAAIVAVYLTLSLASVATTLPWSDEAWFSSPALNLITKGSFGTSVLDPTADFRTNHNVGIDQHTYWIPPLYPLMQAGWHRILGFSLRSVRLYSVLWGLVALMAASWFMWGISHDRRVAGVTAALLAVDFTFIKSASVGRMDIMCAALGVLAFAVYLSLRQRHLAAAILLSQSCIVASGLSHPHGLAYFAGLAALTLWLDSDRLRPSHAIAGGVPYLIGACGWGLYILEAPDQFQAQFFGNAASRFVQLSHPLATLHAQVVERFLYAYGLAPDTQGISHLKVIVLVAYIAGVLGTMLTRDLRRHAPVRTLSLVSLASCLTVMAFDRLANIHYLLHSVIFLSFFLATWIVWCWDRQPAPRWLLAAGVAVVFATQLAVSASRVAADQYRSRYLPVTAFLRDHASRSDLIVGSAELAFELGFDGRVVDDYRLGFRSGKRPDFIVLDRNRYQEWIPSLEQQEPPAFAYIRDLLSHFTLRFENPAYRIYERIRTPG